MQQPPEVCVLVAFMDEQQPLASLSVLVSPACTATAKAANDIERITRFIVGITSTTFFAYRKSELDREVPQRNYQQDLSGQVLGNHALTTVPVLVIESKSEPSKTMKNILKYRNELVAKLAAVDAIIADMGGNSTASARTTRSGNGRRKKRRNLSAAARARIGAAQKARWARLKSGK